ncbi:hypothetical protein GQ55_7G338800 [Panicum hallii var. hallii]|uniref:Uncharacterized protein n=1 Tax=Panicum hallii var. hallii TaxID=1504633 RepID=A0A2T7D1Y6_9POAL|nr:hypothetical protein GQ55_7G338800 [Panicum hallii var. hallii]
MPIPSWSPWITPPHRGTPGSHGRAAGDAGRTTRARRGEVTAPTRVSATPPPGVRGVMGSDEPSYLAGIVWTTAPGRGEGMVRPSAVSSCRSPGAFSAARLACPSQLVSASPSGSDSPARPA